LEELYGRPPSLIWNPEPQSAGLAGLYAMLGDGQSARLELPCRRKDGSSFWADVGAVPVADEISGERRLVAILRDVTERRRLEEALRQSEATFRLLFSSNPIPMWAYEVGTSRILEVNNAAVEQYGYSREAFLAMTVDDIAPPDAAPAGFPRRRAIPAFGRLGIRRHRKADGGEISVDAISHRLDFQGHQAAIMAALDVTEQQRAEEEIRRAKEAAEAASRAKTELVADIRHSAGHLLTVITDILDLAKIEANSFRLHEGIVAPREVIASALRLVKPRADDAGISLHYDRRHGDLAIKVDETALKRVLINLLANAVKFSEAGGSVVVSSEFDVCGGFAISVADQGIGMAPEEIPIALTPFRQ